MRIDAEEQIAVRGDGPVSRRVEGDSPRRRYLGRATGRPRVRAAK